jgi:hypothetical protein
MEPRVSDFPRSPRTLNGGLVLLDPETGSVLRIIEFQYNPETVSRTIQPQFSEQQNSDRTVTVRFKAPAVEQIKLEAELDATDQLEAEESTGLEFGIHPQLAALEALVQPTTSELREIDRLAQQGTLEIIPPEAPLVVFVWGKSRVAPVKVTELSITEEAFDPKLNPVRAKVSLGLRVLTVNDVGFTHRAGSLFLAYLQNRENLAREMASGSFARLGISGVS